MKDFTMMNQSECIDALNKEITNLKEDQILDRAIIDRLRKDNEKLTSQSSYARLKRGELS